jgi:hypothetical protein
MVQLPYLDNVEGLVDRGLGVKGEPGVDLGGDLAGNNLENLLAELDQQAVEGIVDLLLNVAALLLGVVDGDVYQLGVLGLLGGGQDEGGVGGGILGLVLGDGCAVLSMSAVLFASEIESGRDESWSCCCCCCCCCWRVS